MWQLRLHVPIEVFAKSALPAGGSDILVLLQVLDYLAADDLVKEKGLTRQQCETALQEIGFRDDHLPRTVSTLSGVGAALRACLSRAAMRQV